MAVMPSKLSRLQRWILLRALQEPRYKRARVADLASEIRAALGDAPSLEEKDAAEDRIRKLEDEPPDLYFWVIKAGYYVGLPAHFEGLDHPVFHKLEPLGDLEPTLCDARRYAAASAAVSRAVRSLVKRGLVQVVGRFAAIVAVVGDDDRPQTIVEAGHPYQRGVVLTDEGARVAQAIEDGPIFRF
jgi:hypothetical protein